MPLDERGGLPSARVTVRLAGPWLRRDPDGASSVVVLFATGPGPRAGVDLAPGACPLGAAGTSRLLMYWSFAARWSMRDATACGGDLEGLPQQGGRERRGVVHDLTQEVKREPGCSRRIPRAGGRARAAPRRPPGGPNAARGAVRSAGARPRR